MASGVLHLLAQGDLLDEVQNVLQLNGPGLKVCPGPQPSALQVHRVLDAMHGAEVSVITLTKADPEVTRAQAPVPAPGKDVCFRNTVIAQVQKSLTKELTEVHRTFLGGLTWRLPIKQQEYCQAYMESKSAEPRKER